VLVEDVLRACVYDGLVVVAIVEIEPEGLTGELGVLRAREVVVGTEIEKTWFDGAVDALVVPEAADEPRGTITEVVEEEVGAPLDTAVVAEGDLEVNNAAAEDGAEEAGE
jgi:hypothetical protein